MFKLFNIIIRNNNAVHASKRLVQCRTFLSQAYYCNEVWGQRLNDPIVRQVNLDELYNELDQAYNKTKNISAVDVDIFTNAVREEMFTDELLDIIHKLRISTDASNILPSTSHIAIRSMLSFGKKEQLLNALDDRLNYGLFLDDFTANLLLDTFWKNGDYTSGSRVASQLMLQEDFRHPISASLSLLHCYHFLQNPINWPEPPKQEEPEEEIKFRVNYLRNPYDDNHFDLRDPLKIVGKTIAMITKPHASTLEKSLHLLGLALFQRHNDVAKLSEDNEKIYEIAGLLPEENDSKQRIKKLAVEEGDVGKLLVDRVRAAVDTHSEKDIAAQCEAYLKWEEERKNSLAKQQERLEIANRLANIEESQKKLKEKEMLLWYFENEEKLELEIEQKKAQLGEKLERKQQSIKKSDDDYVPPEVYKTRAQ